MIVAISIMCSMDDSIIIIIEMSISIIDVSIVPAAAGRRGAG